MTLAQQHHYADFTEENYRRLLALAQRRYIFISYPQHAQPGRNILWRHDVDYSIHRALALARIEHEAGVKATYFIYPHCSFYNLFEWEVASRVREIIALGHDIGLHADHGFLADYFSDDEQREAFLRREKAFMEELFGQKLVAVSFHQPELRNKLGETDATYSGMINTYSAEIFSRYSYCSDSNGHWRYRRLEEVLLDERIENLQILTHPAWWTPEVLAPAKRIMRCLDGREKAAWALYCGELEMAGRASENYGVEELP